MGSGRHFRFKPSKEHSFSNKSSLILTCKLIILKTSFAFKEYYALTISKTSREVVAISFKAGFSILIFLTISWLLNITRVQLPAAQVGK